jgi:hypothetical protein
MRYDPEVIEAFRAGGKGKGWQTRMNEALKDWLRTHPKKGCFRKIGSAGSRQAAARLPR